MAPPVVYCRTQPPRRSDIVFFYELHEGDDQVYSDVLVVSESEWEPQEFFEVVQRIRRDIGDQYERDTLIEAIGVVLERDHGFVFVTDDRLVAAVNVSTQEDDNFIVDLEAGYEEDDEGDDDDRDDDEPRGDYRTLVTDVEFDIDDGSRTN
jgi:hypothetical protein